MRVGKVNTPKSKKKLFETLAQITGHDGWSLKSPRIGSENFGRMSCIFISTDNNEQKKLLERKLNRAGHRVNFNYNPNGGSVEVQVTYFKGADRVDKRKDRMIVQNFEDIISGKCKPTCFSEAYAVMKKCTDDLQDPETSPERKEQASLYLALYADPELRVLAFRLIAQHPLAIRYCEDMEAQWS